ncbi:ATP-dependent DNA helicase sgs1 [Xylographa vitiligo]|nr:ATP-dependent DNA helicase sgs1 [Xylographa vitiligo]
MVHRYGKYLMKLIRTTEQGYHSMRDEEDRPYDPNHQHVVIISDDEENVEVRDFDDLEGEFASQEERSAYFEPQAEVEAFNAELAQIQTFRPTSQAPQDHRGGKGARGGSRGGSRGAYKGWYKSNRKSSGGSNKAKASIDGVKKKASGSRSNGGGFGGGAGSTKGGYNTSGFGEGGIGMMPT